MRCEKFDVWISLWFSRSAGVEAFIVYKGSIEFSSATSLGLKRVSTLLVDGFGMHSLWQGDSLHHLSYPRHRYNHYPEAASH